tara:strand:- start:1423 stop:1656 length:234 start_codon:yes stop_codon:yes gene_type:complete
MFLILDRRSASERRRKLAMMNVEPKKAKQRTSFCFPIFLVALRNIPGSLCSNGCSEVYGFSQNFEKARKYLDCLSED